MTTKTSFAVIDALTQFFPYYRASPTLESYELFAAMNFVKRSELKMSINRFAIRQSWIRLLCKMEVNRIENMCLWFVLVWLLSSVSGEFPVKLLIVLSWNRTLPLFITDWFSVASFLPTLGNTIPLSIAFLF